MAESLSRKINPARSKLALLRAAPDVVDARTDAVMVDARYGDTLRNLMPRRLSSLTRPRPRD